MRRQKDKCYIWCVFLHKVTNAYNSCVLLLRKMPSFGPSIGSGSPSTAFQPFLLSSEGAFSYCFEGQILIRTVPFTGAYRISK